VLGDVLLQLGRRLVDLVDVVQPRIAMLPFEVVLRSML
jgi:hypothetical protein